MLSPLLRRYTWNSAWLYNARIFIALCGTTAVPWWLGEVKLTIPLTLGVVAAALTDLDDRLAGRLRNLAITLVCFFIASASVELLFPWPWLFALGLTVSTTGFILLGGLGQRYATIAFGALLIAIYTALKDRPGYPEQPRLVVLADPCGCSWLAASDDDWLIPFGIMGAPVSGLISRSVWSSEGLHGCMVCEHLSEFECSRMLVDTVAHFRKKLTPTSLAPLSWNTESARILWQTSRDVIAFLADEFKVDSVNRIKPGIAEATRAVLRRVPDHIFVRSIDDPDVALLVGLAREKGIVVTEMGGTLGQYRAVTIIKKVL